MIVKKNKKIKKEIWITISWQERERAMKAVRKPGRYTDNEEEDIVVFSALLVSPSESKCHSSVENSSLHPFHHFTSSSPCFVKLMCSLLVLSSPILLLLKHM